MWLGDFEQDITTKGYIFSFSNHTYFPDSFALVICCWTRLLENLGSICFTGFLRQSLEIPLIFRYLIIGLKGYSSDSVLCYHKLRGLCEWRKQKEVEPKYSEVL